MLGTVLTQLRGCGDRNGVSACKMEEEYRIAPNFRSSKIS